MGRHTPLIVVLALALPLLFLNLGGPLLWSDEADTAVFAQSILESGVPSAWDGRNFLDSDVGRRLSPDLVMVGTPWLPYYLNAASFALFGESAWAARLPFATAGLGTLALLYFLVLRAGGGRRAAFGAALLLLLSVQFLLYARECRHYPLNMLLCTGLLLSFLRLRDHPRDPWLVLTAVLLFHTHPLPALAILGALAVLLVVHPDFVPLRRAFALRLAIVLPLTLPWVAVAARAWTANTAPLPSLAELGPRTFQFAIESIAAIPYPGWALLLAAAWSALGRAQRAWLALAALVVAAHGALSVLALGEQMWVYGLRYVAGLLPVTAAVTGILVAGAARGRKPLYAALLLLFGLTHVPGSLLPWTLLERLGASTPQWIGLHLPERGIDRILRTELPAYASGLWRENPGTVSALVDFLHREAGPDDVLITNYAWDPLYFHTGLPQGLKLLPNAPGPVLRAAQERGLPRWIFGVQDARWVVWRPAWEGYLGYRFEWVEAALARHGARLQAVATFPETKWENRPELHFHRFPGDRYLFPDNVARIREASDAVVYRVLGPETDPVEADAGPGS